MISIPFPSKFLPHRLVFAVVLLAPFSTSAQQVQGFAVGIASGAPPLESTYLGLDTTPISSLEAFNPAFTGGLTLAGGDFNGSPDIVVGAGPGGGPQVNVFSGKDGSLLESFSAFNPSFTGGISVASGNLNANGYADIIVGAGPGAAPQVNVFTGQNGSLLQSFFAFDSNFTGGVRVATGAIGGPGTSDIVVGTARGASQVNVFDGQTDALLSSYLPYGSFTGGVNVAVGDVDGDGHADIIVAPGAGSAGGPEIKVYSGATGSLLQSFLAFNSSFTGGVTVAAADLTGNGYDDIIAATASNGGEVRIFDGETDALVADFMPEGPSYTGGLNVAGVVPEPASGLMLLLSGIGLCVRRPQSR